MIQVPITLIHSISLDPPPSQEAALKMDMSDAKHVACRQMLVDLFRHTPATEEDDDDDAFKESGISLSYHKQAYQQQPMVRHGFMWSPKQFGKRPGCLGNAGLDIRRKLNVATAQEAWHGYTAEHYYFPTTTGEGGTSQTSPITPVDERRRMLPFDMEGNTSVRSGDNERKILALLEHQLACDLPPPSIVHTF